MQIEKIDILDFKNIPQAEMRFSSGVNCLLGRNGMGKSNLLEAIHMLCLGRPMHQVPEAELVRHGQEAMLLKGEFLSESGTTDRVTCGIVKGKGKSVKLNGKEYSKLSDHIGRFPTVTVTPADSMIVSGAAEERRRLIDMVLSQSDATYLANLIRYRRALETRNKMLRAGIRDQLLYESVEAALCEAAAPLHTARRDWTEAISPRLHSIYTQISGGQEEASLVYKSALNTNTMAEVLAERTEKDRVLGYTSGGLHRDDLDTRMGQYSMRRLGSQGQLKTFTIALRLAVFEYLRDTLGSTPILLLDDIFDKLDAARVRRIMQLVSRKAQDAAEGQKGFGQIFITDTNREHLDEILESIDGPRLLLEVSDGCFSTVTPDIPADHTEIMEAAEPPLSDNPGGS